MSASRRDTNDNQTLSKTEQGSLKALLEKVRLVAQDIGFQDQPSDQARLARALDKRGVSTPQGGKWCDGKSPKPLVDFLAKHPLEALGTSTPNKSATAPQRPSLKNLTYRVEQLEEWRNIVEGELNIRRDVGGGQPVSRPMFAGKKKNTGIRVNARLLEDAQKKAREPGEVLKIGAGLSPLIEFLLWQYLGFDQGYLRSEGG